MRIKSFDQFNENLNKLLIDQMLKKRAKERTAKKESDDIELSESEIKDILKAVKTKKYDMLANLDKMQKLQKMRLVRSPRGVEIQSSFSSLFYLTKKGEKLIQ